MELITGKRRRRLWTDQEKARIVAESAELGANISEVARRHGVARGVLSVWRRQAGVVATPTTPTPGFVPIQIAAEASRDADHYRSHFGDPAEERLPPGGAIEIELYGARIRVGADVAPATLSMVLNVLRGTR